MQRINLIPGWVGILRAVHHAVVLFGVRVPSQDAYTHTHTTQTIITTNAAASRGGLWSSALRRTRIFIVATRSVCVVVYSRFMYVPFLFWLFILNGLFVFSRRARARLASIQS